MASPAPIRGVGLDYSGVVADPPPGNIFEQLSAITGAPTGTIKGAYHRYNRDFQLGRLSQAELWRRVAADLGTTELYDAIWAAAIERLPTPNPAILGLVDRLRAAGYRVGLLTNLAAPTPWSQALYTEGVHRHFDAVGLSGETGLVKPMPEAFQWLAARLGISTTELVFIDDRPAALAGVEDLGIRPIVFTNLEQLITDLRALSVSWQSQNPN